VVAEIESIMSKYGGSFIQFNDSLVNGNRKNFLDICSLIVQKKLKITWGGNCRVDNSLGNREFKLIKASGCDYLTIGAESASNRILSAMRKGFTIEDVESFANKARDWGILLDVNWVVGFPGESEDDFSKTCEFVRSRGNLVRRHTFSTLAINQFSYLEKNLDEFGIVLNGHHLGLWQLADGSNTSEIRNSRLEILENIACARDNYVVRQKEP
jgi:radical SAM superfamily enzyme YgiQ (UPF0313 family)